MSDTYEQVSALIDRLGQFYRDYTTEATRVEAEQNAFERLSSLFAGSSRFANDSMHPKFYEGCKKQVEEITPLMALLTDPAQTAPLAEKAVRILLNPVPDSMRDTIGWMHFAAEPLCAPFLPYLDRKTLRAVYENYMDVYPKYSQFPAQVTLRKEMERLLKK